MSPIARKNSWQVAEQIGERTPKGMQRLLNESQWDAAQVRDDLRAYGVAHLGDPAAVLVLDETGFLKKGTKSAGVAPQYCGTAGKVANCQVGVLLAYASATGHTLLDRELYLPKAWAADRARRAAAGIPEAVAFATKPQLAQQMLERTFRAGVPAAWVTGDSVYGSDRRLRLWLEEQEQPFVLGIASDEPLWVNLGRGPEQARADAIAVQVRPAAWRRLSAGEGAKGPRLYDWVRVPLARLAAPPWEHWLRVRRSLSEPPELAYYVVFAPAGTTLEELVTVAGQRWRVEEGIERAKHEVGLDEYEVRRWDGWYRHVTLAMLALACLTVMRQRAVNEGGEKGGPSPARM